MENTSMLIAFLAGAIVLWELSAISFTNKKIKVRAEIPGQKLGIGIFAAACALIIFVRWGVDMWQLIGVGLILLAGVLNFLMKNGLSEYGAYINGWSTSYEAMKYYDVESFENNRARLRISSTRREIVFLLPEKDLQLAIAYLDKNKIYDMETYRMLKARMEQERK